ncbi:C-type lectin domain family 4 member M-like [Drosophila gunungcola]|uniref:C-type lectin domain family 4 member M-like n=1 Tax=Drosophila gunungcola TaxID=103775 RepID=UPI0022DF62D1|nr:C-type lectin domain family 4 member M-like [Drosophila gunungcola]
MFKWASYFLCSFAVLASKGSWATLQDNNQTVCILKDAPNQCGSFCLSALDPMQTNLDAIERKQGVITSQLWALISRQDVQQKSLPSLDYELRRHTEMQEKHISHLLAVQSEMQALQKEMLHSILDVYKKLNAHQTLVQESLDKSITKEVFENRLEGVDKQLLTIGSTMAILMSRSVDQPHTVQNQSLQSPQASLQESLSEIGSEPPQFEQIGSRHFFIEHNLRLNWTMAAQRCRQIGGHLASFQNRLEFNAVTAKLLTGDVYYWIGMNDLGQEGQFVSVASGNPVAFFDWGYGEPDNLGGNHDCVDIAHAKMWDSKCADEERFICQSDNEV